MLSPEIIDKLENADGYTEINIEDLEDLGAIKTLSFDDYSGHRVKSIGITDNFIILPKKLILRQNTLSIKENFSSKLNAEVRVLLTNDMKHFYKYLNHEFVMTTDFSTGMPINYLPEIDFTNWQGNLGIAVAIFEMQIDREIEVKDLFMQANNTFSIVASGEYKISFGTLVDTEMKEISIATNEDIDAMFD